MTRRKATPALHCTSAQQLQLLTSNLTGGSISTQLTVYDANYVVNGHAGNFRSSTEIYAVSNNMLLALDKIVLNTYATSKNTSLIAVAGGAGVGAIQGTYSLGGMVGNGKWNQDSVLARHADGSFIGLAGGEWVTRAPSVNADTLDMLDYINRNGEVPDKTNVVPFPGATSPIAPAAAPSFANASRPQGDFIGELRALRQVVQEQKDELKALRKSVEGVGVATIRATTAGAEHVRSGVDGIVRATNDQTREIALYGARPATPGRNRT